ncbi:matrixin family metalloprotease [Saccharomonospora sp. NPDC046836]|uniref:matrixin family metalloprotease n=1 Tax=Saccharomonospora sp. NPDC046836 TaxID=3156921 RepID=UPI0033FFC529
MDACAQGSYRHFDNQPRWYGALSWWYNASTAARANLPADGTRAALRAANQHVTLGHNNCGRPTGQFTSVGAYQGDHELFANINSVGQCTNLFPNSHNTVSWGASDTGFLGVLCGNGFCVGGLCSFTESDMYLASNRGLRLSFPGGCSNLYDAEGVMTHEWGHAFGLDHVEGAGATDLTMFPFLDACRTNWRSLGLGDWLGMDALY